MEGQCSVGQGVPPLHKAYSSGKKQVVASNQEAAPDHRSDSMVVILVVSCRQYDLRAANVCQ